MQYLGDFAEDATVYIPFNTFTSDDPQASATITNLVDADIKVHKDGGVVQIVTDGATVAIDFDSITGNHLNTIETSVHADYATGSDYQVRIEGTTVDAGTINAWVGYFSIENRFNDVNVVSLGGGVQSLTDLKDFADEGYDPATNKVQGVVLVDTATTVTGGATAANQTTLLNRIGSFTGTGVNTILGLFQAALRSDATAATDIGGTFDSSTDSAEAIRNQIDALAATPGVGARPFVPTTITPVIGTNPSGTPDDLANDDANVYTLNDDAGSLTLDLDYQLDPDAVMIQAIFLVAAQGVGDDLSYQLYDQVGMTYDTFETIPGSNSLTYVSIDKNTVGKYTSEDGLFQARITGTGLVNATLTINVGVGYAISTVRSVGYAKGRLWYDDNNGVAGSTPFINGTADTRKCSAWADVMTLSSPSSVGITDIQVINGSTAVLTTGIDNYSIFGDNYTVDTNGQSIAGAFISGASLVGASTALSECHFDGSTFGNYTVELGHFDFCRFSGTLTQNRAGLYEYHNCYSSDTSPPVFTKTPGMTITAEFHNWSGDIVINGLEAGDMIELGGEFRTVTLNGTAATVHVHGLYEDLANNMIDQTNVEVDGAIKAGDVADTLADTNELQTNQGNWLTATGFATPTNITAGTITTVTNLTNAATSGDLTATMKSSVTTAATAATPIAASVSGNVDGSIGSLGAQAKLDVNAEADTALVDYDGPTNAEMVARTKASADYFDSATDPVEILATGGTAGGKAADEIVFDTWEEILTGGTHNTSNSSGKRLRSIQEVGVYPSGFIYYDSTGGGSPGSNPFENGTVDNPVDNEADLRSLIASTARKRVSMSPGSSITFAGAYTDTTFIGKNWTLALGGQAVNSLVCTGAVSITGISSSATGVKMDDCIIGAATMPPGLYTNCGWGLNGGLFAGASAGEYIFSQGYSVAPGQANPDFDFTGLGASTGINNRMFSGGAEYTLDSDCVMSHDGAIGGNVSVTTGGATSEVRGTLASLILVLGTGTSEQVRYVGTCGPVSISGSPAGASIGLYGIVGEITNTSGVVIDNHAVSLPTIKDQADQALVDYGVPTSAELEARTLPSAEYATEVNVSSNEAKIDLLQIDSTAILEDTGATIPAQITATDGKVDLLLDGVLKTNTAGAFHVKMVDVTTTPPTPISGEAVTMTKMLDGAAFTSATGTASTTNSDGMSLVSYAAADVNGTDAVTFKFTATGATPVTLSFKLS